MVIIQKIIASNNYLYYMKLGANDLKMIVTECVQRILEYHGAIDDSFEKLAEIILKRLKTEKNFTLSPEEINTYYPYSVITRPLNVQRVPLVKAIAAYNPTTDTLKVSPITQLYKNEYFISVIIHELTHFVNNTESDDVFLRHNYPDFGNDTNEETAKKIAYLFDFSEMTARVSQFKWTLKARKKNGYRPLHKLSAFEDTTYLSEMRNLIEAVKADVFPDSEEEPLSLVELLLYRRAFHKTAMDGRDRELNMSKNDYEKTKAAIVRKMTKAYRDYYSKIAKIFYDEMD